MRARVPLPAHLSLTPVRSGSIRSPRGGGWVRLNKRRPQTGEQRSRGSSSSRHAHRRRDALDRLLDVVIVDVQVSQRAQDTRVGSRREADAFFG